MYISGAVSAVSYDVISNHEQKAELEYIDIYPVFSYVAGLKNVKLLPSLLSRWLLAA